METQVCKELKERQDCRDHQQEEQSTLAGAVPPAPLTRELHSSTLEELERHPMTPKEEQQTICVYQMILTISSTRVECKDRAMLVGWSIFIMGFHRFLLSTITMLPVLCAMWPPEVWQ